MKIVSKRESGENPLQPTVTVMLMKPYFKPLDENISGKARK
ncbi:hypothetical protein BD780_000523 [Clostridium tetanomorphum]|nr:hypothetical protein [Clostridium tetanomorphum]NRS83298.1 hypothetical protein [Clostridium tetanomorphum]